MKKIFLLIAPLLLASCADDDSKATNDTTAKTTAINAFHPPLWIQGAWAPESSTQEFPYSYVFKGDNICHSAANTNTVCWNETLEGLAEGTYSFEERATESEYTVIYNVGGNVTSVTFTRLDSNKINVFVPEGADPQQSTGVFIKQ